MYKLRSKVPFEKRVGWKSVGNYEVVSLAARKQPINRAESNQTVIKHAERNCFASPLSSKSLDILSEMPFDFPASILIRHPPSTRRFQRRSSLTSSNTWRIPLEIYYSSGRGSLNILEWQIREWSARPLCVAFDRGRYFFHCPWERERTKDREFSFHFEQVESVANVHL